VRYCIVGGLAVNLHGIPRTTYDVDVVVARDVDDLGRAEKVLRSLGLLPRIPVILASFADAAYCDETRATRNLVAVTFTNPSNPLEEVDVLVAPDIDPTLLVERSIVREAGGLRARIVSLEDLLAMKRAAGRPQDLADIAHLERLKAT
jgi:hypothetical protein